MGNLGNSLPVSNVAHRSLDCLGRRPLFPDQVRTALIPPPPPPPSSSSRFLPRHGRLSLCSSGTRTARIGGWSSLGLPPPQSRCRNGVKMGGADIHWMRGTVCRRKPPVTGSMRFTSRLCWSRLEEGNYSKALMMREKCPEAERRIRGENVKLTERKTTTCLLVVEWPTRPWQ